MLEELFYLTYHISYPVLLVITVCILTGGAVMHTLASERAKHIVGVIGSAFTLWLIVYSTLLMRSEEAGEIILQPGYSLQMALISDVYLRMVIMNVFLFVPFGMFISLAFSGRTMGKMFLITVIAGLIVTLAVELLQYIFRLGCAETDDVICNVAGTLIGFLPCLIAGLAHNARQRQS